MSKARQNDATDVQDHSSSVMFATTSCTCLLTSWGRRWPRDSRRSLHLGDNSGERPLTLVLCKIDHSCHGRCRNHQQEGDDHCASRRAVAEIATRGETNEVGEVAKRLAVAP